MKGKFEDKLARLAFGELNPQEAARLEQEAQSDPEALRALSLYKEMREGLRSLSDIPEDQFSKERLRDAILTQGLKPVPTRPISNRAWLWMPAAACVLGFGLMVGQNSFRKRNGEPNVVINIPESRLTATKLPPIDFSVPKTTVAKLVPPTPEKHSSPMVVARNEDSGEVDPRVKASAMYEDAFDPDLGSVPSGNSGSFRNALADNSPSTSKPASSTGQIVLIEQDTDQQTGACKAKEVGTNNVLVGG